MEELISQIVVIIAVPCGIKYITGYCRIEIYFAVFNAVFIQKMNVVFNVVAYFKILVILKKCFKRRNRIFILTAYSAPFIGIYAYPAVVNCVGNGYIFSSPSAKAFISSVFFKST